MAKKIPGVFRINKVWYISYQANGKQMRESSHSTKQADAVKLRFQRIADAQQGIYASTVTVGTLLDDLVDEANVRELRSMRAIKARVATIRGELGNIKASSLGPSHLRVFRNRLLEKGLSHASVNRHFEVLHRAFVLAYRMRIVSTIPSFPERLPEAEPRQGFFEREDFDRICAELPQWAADVFEFSYYTGWRRNEILGMPWSEVDWGAKEIRLGQSRSKNGRARLRPIGPDIEPVMHRRISGRVLGCAVVFHRDGKRVPNSTWSQVWRAACARAGYPDAKLHDARRTAVRNMIRAGIPEGVAMAMTGHKTRLVFDRYNIVSGDDLRDASERLKRHLDGAEVRRFATSGSSDEDHEPE